MSNRKLNVSFLVPYLLLLGLLIGFHKNGTAQNNGIKLSFDTNSKVKMSYERALGQKSSLQLNFRYSYNTAYYPSRSNSRWISNKKLRDLDEGTRIGLEYRQYLTGNKKLDGLYVAPSIAFGQHNLAHWYKDGTEDHNIFGITWETQLYSKSKMQVNVLGYELKLGHQKKWRSFILDLGLIFAKNKVLGEKTAMQLGNGHSVNFPKSVNGVQLGFYCGFGLAF